MGLPVIGSCAAFEGINFQVSLQGHERFLPANFAKEVSRLLVCANTRRLVGDEARQFIQSHYSLEVVGPRYQELYEKMASQSTVNLQKLTSMHQPEWIDS